VLGDRILEGDNLELMKDMPAGVCQLIYADPPFNTGKRQKRVLSSYEDAFDDYLAFLRPRLQEMHRLLDESGTLYLHIDYREAHYVKLALDEIFGRECFLNEIIWAYDYGGRAKRRWPAKHDTILVYVKDLDQYYFDSSEVDREPYMAPGLVSAEKVARGKLPTDVWWHTIVHTTGREKTGYPTQKPEGIVRRMVLASTREGDHVLDPFAGSGTLGAVARQAGRRYTLIDASPDAIAVMYDRLEPAVEAAS
jgi:site-specific DNA-methyltransferase (adenine-specific)